VQLPGVLHFHTPIIALLRVNWNEERLWSCKCYRLPSYVVGTTIKGQFSGHHSFIRKYRCHEEAMDSLSNTAVKRGIFPFLSLPHELQIAILAESLDRGVSVTTLLCLARHLHPEIILLLYTHIFISSNEQLKLFLGGNSSLTKHTAQYARTLTVSLHGVPGSSVDPNQTRQIDKRLLLASRAIQLCPNISHCSLQMFGVRHSSLLSDGHINEETTAFRIALSHLKSLKSFSWLTPKENLNFVGFSVAVVDLAFEPLIHGLEVAAMDMDVDGHRVIVKDGSQRYVHPLEEVTLHHCIFPSDRGRLFFQLFTKRHPDDPSSLLFPRLKVINIKRACNVDSINDPPGWKAH
jgi:hypothetical protein